MIVEYYRGANGGWYWRIRDAHNHRVLAVGGEGYATKYNVKRAFSKLAERLQIKAMPRVEETPG